MELMLRVSSIPEAGSILTSTLGGWGEVDHSPQSQKTLPFALPADPNTLFRSNSLASKSMEQFMKVSRRRPAGAQQLPQGHPSLQGLPAPELGGLQVAVGSDLGAGGRRPASHPEWQLGSAPTQPLGMPWPCSERLPACAPCS